MRQIRRALDSMALAQLFTHETDYIYKIHPDRWRMIVGKIAREIAPYHPELVTLEEGMRRLRDTKTSAISDGALDPETSTVRVTFKGTCQGASQFAFFAGQDEEPELVNIPPFEGFTFCSFNVFGGKTR